ncbi:MAG: glycosyltransferase family 2 protein [Planctomycetota bacterium JB042]
MSAPAHDVAAVLVNYNSGALCVEAVRSLRAQTFPGGRLQIVVVDNASPEDQRELLAPLDALDVDVVLHDENLGYGGGMNLGMARVDARHVLLSNPDVLALDGAVGAMAGLLDADPSVGMVGPRGFLEPSLFVSLPPNDLPTLRLHVEESLGRVDREIARRASLERTRRFLRAWEATGPLDMRMVSGFGFMMPADLARTLGPFDEAFPFYFEDADLCRRVRAAGRRVVLEPRARMIHYFDRSARTAREEVLRKYEVSRERYYRKHYGPAGARLYAAMNAHVAAHAEADGWRFFEPDDLGVVDGPLDLDLGAAAGGRAWVAEIATDPSFLFCGGRLGDGAALRFTSSAWDALVPTRWYVRVLAADDLDCLRYVTFEKTTPDAYPAGFEAARALWKDAT